MARRRAVHPREEIGLRSRLVQGRRAVAVWKQHTVNPRHAIQTQAEHQRPENGEKFPGIWPSELWADGAVRDVVTRASNYYLGRQALLQLEIGRITYRNDPEHFNLSNIESWKFPGDWKLKGEVDVIFVNRFEKEGVAGRAKFPCFGETVAVSVIGNLPGKNDPVMSNEDMAITMVHELGHHLGLSHGTADKDTTNIMFNNFTLGTQLSGFELTSDQVREMQDRLANNLARRGERID